MITTEPSGRTPQPVRDQCSSDIARLRRRQLELARQGKVMDSVECAERAQRILDHLQRGAAC